MTGIMPFFANKGYHLNITVHPKRDLVSTRTHDFVTDLDELHQELRKHIAMPSIATRFLLIPDILRLLNSQLVVTPSSRHSSFI